MNKVYNYLRVLGYYFAVLWIFVLFISIFYYFEILDFNVINLITYIFILVLNCFIGIKISRLERKKGYINGFIVGALIFAIFSIFTLFMKEYSVSTLIYYLTLILSSMIGGIIGVPNEK